MKDHDVARRRMFCDAIGHLQTAYHAKAGDVRTEFLEYVRINWIRLTEEQREILIRCASVLGLDLEAHP